MPASRSLRAMSSVRGNWFDCTPTSPTMPKPPFCVIWRIMRLIGTRALVSSSALISIATSGPSTCLSAASAASA